MESKQEIDPGWVYLSLNRVGGVPRSKRMIGRPEFLPGAGKKNAEEPEEGSSAFFFPAAFYNAKRMNICAVRTRRNMTTG